MVSQPIEVNDFHIPIRSRPMYFVQLTIDEHTVGDTPNAFPTIVLRCSTGRRRNLDFPSAWSTSIDE